MSDETPADSTRGRILKAATEIFAEKGFLKATVREICAKADVNLALVNYHFGSKENLYIAVVEQMFAAGPSQLVGLVDTVHDEASWRAAIRQWLASSLQTVTSSEPPLCYLRAFIAQAPQAPQKVRDELHARHHLPLRRDLIRLIKMALPDDLSAREVELEASLWCASLEAICLAHAVSSPSWGASFCPNGVSERAWLKSELGWMTRSLFSQLKFRRIV